MFLFWNGPTLSTTSLPVRPSMTPQRCLTDSHGRVIHDLRVSITDRCNYKCVYCRSGEGDERYSELSIG